MNYLLWERINVYLSWEKGQHIWESVNVSVMRKWTAYVWEKGE